MVYETEAPVLTTGAFTISRLGNRLAGSTSSNCAAA
ncbi:hypothetical protein SAMN02745244_02942 [Tessaracoccus bendigoensis DSM 12906]|uniref:Uncharacterized protein n=1 Tax=Tessaracoccus bendigoensis DSM 12906 TaxID=1123357 RepID=A0A1M6KZ51_9ACTN|nr:hypothetical protein SAMN02745244_02942 [Tessaracoccus bendigoensis DSM 12906]